MDRSVTGVVSTTPFSNSAELQEISKKIDDALDETVKNLDNMSAVNKIWSFVFDSSHTIGDENCIHFFRDSRLFSLDTKEYVPEDTVSKQAATWDKSLRENPLGKSGQFWGLNESGR